jgi:hypothetical protein
MQILMSDYIQHYGLQRLPLPSGRLEPVGLHHSWNAPKGFSSYLMMNAPTHSAHHLHPDRRFDELAAATRPHPAPVPAGHGGDRDRSAALAPDDGPPRRPRHGRRRRTDRRHGARRGLT